MPSKVKSGFDPLYYSLLPNIIGAENKWILRLIEWTEKQQVVFRAQGLSSAEYTTHIRSLADWEGRTENAELCDLLEAEMPAFVWAVEVSTPQLFPANERKLGEIVLDATRPLNLQDETAIFDSFILSRLPCTYLFGGDITHGTPQFTAVPSQIESHTNLINL